MSKILVTGGAGFIGVNLAARCLKQNNKVVVYDNLSRKNSDKNLAWLKSLKKSRLEVFVEDIRDFESLRRQVQKADVVFHLAGQTAVTSSIKDPKRDFEVNVLGTLNVLEAARRVKCKPIVVYSSTNKVYGKISKSGREVSEDYRLDFCSPYACSKGAGDQYVLDYARTYSLPGVVLRQSCIYGPYQLGSKDQGWVAHFAASALLGRLITIYGSGKQVRDVMEIDDLIEVYELAVQNIKRSKGQVYNIGGGRKNATSLLALIADLEKIVGSKIECRYSSWRLGDQKRYVSDIRKAKKELGWEPRVGKKRGLIRLCNWIKKNKDYY